MSRIVKYPDLACAILAGGKNSRFLGENKAFIEIGNSKIFDLILKTVSGLFREIIVVTNSPEDFSSYKEIIVTEDYYKNMGPIGGIHAALIKAESSAVFVIACDMPFIKAEIISEICNFFYSNPSDILVPVVNMKNEPLHAIYTKKILPEIQKLASSQSNKAIRNIFPLVNTQYIEIKKRIISFSNINSHDDLNKLKDFVDED